MRKHLNKVLLCSLLLGSIQSLQAQPTGGMNSPDSAPSSVPIDGGLGVLLALGAGYGIRKYRANQQERKNQPPTSGSLR